MCSATRAVANLPVITRDVLRQRVRDNLKKRNICANVVIIFMLFSLCLKGRGLMFRLFTNGRDRCSYGYFANVDLFLSRRVLAV